MSEDCGVVQRKKRGQPRKCKHPVSPHFLYLSARCATIHRHSATQLLGHYSLRRGGGGSIKKYGKRSTFLSQSAPFFLLTSPPHFFWPKLPSPSLIFCCPGCPCAYIRQKVCKVSVQPKLRKKRYSLDVLYWWHHHHFNPEARARKNLYLYPVAAQLPFLYRYIHVQNNSTSFFTCKNNKLNCDLLIKNDNKKSTIKDLKQQPFWKSK